MLYEQFLKEVVNDFKALFNDFEEQVVKLRTVETFDEYFQQIVNDEDPIGEIYREANRFGVQVTHFQTDLYKEVKDFKGLIRHRIQQIERQLEQGLIEQEKLFHAKTAQNLLRRSLG
ncbi:hypothetical protein [Alkalihalobacillus sp. 1P02AB]|uniref:hypothetical protein n=1 Tax=Alkalihalobacillus sp. 1P02AB TaxID=3132260 RepID=UPI0039A64092